MEGLRRPKGTSTHTCLIMPPPPGYAYGIDTWDLGYVQHLVSYFVAADSLTLLITGEVEARQYEARLTDAFSTKIAVISLGDIHRDPPAYRRGELAGGEPFILQSWALYRYLQQHPYDLVVFHDRDAPGFLSIRAKRTGLAFPRTRLLTFLHANHELCRYRTFQMPQDPVGEAKRDYAEKYAGEHADGVIVPARCILDWAIDQGWKLPDRVVCLPEAEGTEAFFQGGRQRDSALPNGTGSAPAAPAPKVSVCVTHFNQERHLSQLLPSIAANDYPALEIIVIDDASTDPRSLAYFEELPRQYPEPRWRFLKNDRNLGPAATRNAAAAQATGEYLIFMDGDNVATPTMISDFSRGMVQSGADCLTCWFRHFRGDDPPTDASSWLHTFAPLGPCLEAGFLENVFGDTNFCIKKSVFERLGGFNPTPGLVLEDWEFLARLVLHGYSQDVIPRELFWYRQRDDSLLQRHTLPGPPDCVYRAYQAQTFHPTRYILSRVAVPAVLQTRRLHQQLGEMHQRLMQMEAQLAGGKNFLQENGARQAPSLPHWLEAHPRLKANASRAVNAWLYLRQGRVRRVLDESYSVLSGWLAGGLEALTVQVHRLAGQGWADLRRLVSRGSGASPPVSIGLLADPDAAGAWGEALASLTRLGFPLATPSAARTFDYLYAPGPEAPLLSPQHLQNVALTLHHRAYDFVTVAHDLAARPDQAAAPLANHLVCRSEWLDWFTNPRDLPPPRPLRGRRLRLLPGPQPLEDLPQVTGARVVVVPGDDIFLQSSEASGPELPRPPREVHQAPRLAGPAGTKPVVFIWPGYLAVGGVEKKTLSIIKELKERCDFVVINFVPLKPLAESFHFLYTDQVLGIYDLPELGPPETFLTMLRSLKQVYQPGLIFISNGCDWLCDHARKIRALFHDIPIVDQEVYSTTEGWIRRYHEPGIQSFDRFIAINQEIFAVFRDRLKMDPERLDLIFPPLDQDFLLVTPETFEPKLKVIEELGIPEDRQIFAFVGRLTQQKDPLGFLKMVRNLQDMGDGSYFLMIGNGEYGPAVDEAIGRYALHNITQIPFCPTLSQIYPYLAGLVITSEYEGGPIVLLEALACGVPVMSTDVGLARMLLEHYQSGLVVPFVAGERAFADCFVAWKSHLEFYRQGARAGAAGIKRQFSQSTIAYDYLNCWNRASQTRLGKPLVS